MSIKQTVWPLRCAVHVRALNPLNERRFFQAASVPGLEARLHPAEEATALIVEGHKPV